MPIDTEELDYMVRKILGSYPEEKRWPINIIDEVFSIIAKSKYVYRPQYDRIAGKSGENKHAVNPLIAKLVKEHTGLETIQENLPAQLGKELIQTYTELGQTTDGNY